jgi:hypothetical protein
MSRVIAVRAVPVAASRITDNAICVTMSTADATADRRS